MDRLHCRPHQDTRTGRDRRFCQSSDPEFGKRNPQDRLVRSKQNDNGNSPHDGEWLRQAPNA